MLTEFILLYFVKKGCYTFVTWYDKNDVKYENGI